MTIILKTLSHLKSFSEFDCKVCGRCCHTLFHDLPNVNPILQDVYDVMNDGTGHCVFHDSISGECRIYEKRPWFCRGDDVWEYYFKKNGISKNVAYALYEQQCENLRINGTIEEDDIDIRKAYIHALRYTKSYMLLKKIIEFIKRIVK